VYYGPEAEADGVVRGGEEKRVRVPLSELFPLLADAVASSRTWLRDFQNDEIEVSVDLYELVLAYQYCRRPTA
jgi:hypothetical protein